MSHNNKLIIAAAGSGKTTFLVKKALEKKEGKILITTYTQANEEEIRRKFIEINKCIPNNVTIQTWFSFLIQHGVKPYQGQIGLFDFQCTGLLLVNTRSAIGVKESNIKHFYFSKANKIYSDKLSKFTIRCNEKSNGAIIDRLSRIYTDLFVDEVQDLAGYDLEFLKLLFQSKINVLLVGDPRQVTYLTHHENKHTKYRDGKIEEFIREKCTRCFDVNGIDHDILKKSYRCCSAICDLSNKLYPSFIQTIPDNHKTTEHSGIFLINQADLPSYLSKYKPTQLRWNSATLVDKSLPVFTFGKSKGLEFDRVVIYPTKPFITWLQNNSSKLEPTSRSKFYVAITRAKFSVGIVCDKNLQIDGVEKYIGKQTIQKQSLPIQNKQAYTRQLSLFEEKDSLTN